MDLILKELYKWTDYKKGDPIVIEDLGKCTFYSYTQERNSYNRVIEYINVIDTNGHIHRRKV